MGEYMGDTGEEDVMIMQTATQMASSNETLGSPPRRHLSAAAGAHISRLQQAAAHDAMLADARAIIGDLEQDLGGSEVNGSKPSSALIQQMPMKGVVNSSGSTVPVQTTLEVGLDDGEELGDNPHVLSFYRRKCLELATEVQKRDTEVVQLRRALKEARNASDGLDSPSFPE